ncbi:MAG: hypothetical protein ABR522_05385 [Marinobacter sp.]
MALKDSLQHTFRRLSEDLGKRLEHLNCSLAERALPEDRKPRVSEISLHRKARQAGQKSARLKVVEGAKKAAGDKQA